MKPGLERRLFILVRRRFRGSSGGGFALDGGARLLLLLPRGRGTVFPGLRGAVKLRQRQPPLRWNGNKPGWHPLYALSSTGGIAAIVIVATHAGDIEND